MQRLPVRVPERLTTPKATDATNVGFERREEEHQSSSADSGSLRAPINVIANRIIQNASCVRKRELEQQTTPNPRRSSNVSYRQEQVFNSSVANQQPLSHSQKPAEVHPTIPRNVLQPSYDQSWVNRDVQQCHEEDEQRKLKEEHEQDRQWWANRVSKLGPERAEAHPNTCGLQHSSGEPCNLRDKADDVSDIAIVRPMVAQPDCGSQPNDRVLVQTNSFSQERHNNVPQQAREVRRLNLSISLSRHVENVNLDIRKLNREISISFHYTSSSQEGPSSSL